MCSSSSNSLPPIPKILDSCSNHSDFSLPPSMAETLGNESGGGVRHVLPFFFGVAVVNPPHDQPGEPREQLVFINALARTMVVLENDGDSFEDPFQKRGGRPASKAAIDALPSVEVASGGDEQCAVCLEGWCGGERTAKEMPCKHRFHGGCIERWLNVSGSCPVCRYQMPEEERESGEGIWMSFEFGGGR